MASTTFVDGETLIEASWLNDVNAAVYTPGTQTAADIANVPAGSITATDVQAALNELDTEKQAWDAQLDALALLSTGTASGNIPLVGTKSATESLAGLVELATQAEAEAGTDDTVVMTPLKTAQAIAVLALGIGQSWTSVTRSSGVSVQNTSGKPIVFAMATTNYGTGASVRIEVSSDNVTFYYAADSSNGVTSNRANGSAIVPNGHYYKPTFVGTITFQSELH